MDIGRIDNKIKTTYEFRDVLKGAKKDFFGYILNFNVKHISKSGLSRAVYIYIIKNNNIIDVSYLISKILKYKINTDNYYNLKVEI